MELDCLLEILKFYQELHKNNLNALKKAAKRIEELEKSRGQNPN